MGSRFALVTIIVLALAGSTPMTARSGQAPDWSRRPVSALLRDANGSDPTARVLASRELFRRGPAAARQLAAAGARAADTVSPRRGDMIYTLLNGDPYPSNVAPGSFGLHLDPSVTADELARMARAHGFRAPAAGECAPARGDICYVSLASGRRLANVLRDILVSEGEVATVNLNFVER